MKYILPIILVAATAVLMVLALFGAGQARSIVGIAAGSAVYTPKASTPDQALRNLLVDVQRGDELVQLLRHLHDRMLSACNALALRIICGARR